MQSFDLLRTMVDNDGERHRQQIADDLNALASAEPLFTNRFNVRHSTYELTRSEKQARINWSKKRSEFIKSNIESGWFLILKNPLFHHQSCRHFTVRVERQQASKIDTTHV
mmetsp:Transcript_14708/g.21694  ORF Transcript_14708/g.21694 Transcript_14708/m.21694 type:complete len:111 (+) Transcript_14708:270-602(+)